MKNIFYILSVLVIGGAAFFSFQNSGKLQGEIDLFEEERNRKNVVEGNIEKTEDELADTEAALKKSEAENDLLVADMENMKSRETSYNKSKDQAQAKIDSAEAELAELAAIKKEIDAKFEGLDVPWAEIPGHIAMLKEERKQKGDDLDQLNRLVAKLTKEIADKRAENARQGDRLTEIRTKIGRNSKVGAITSVNSTWGFVIVNLGTGNSNVTANSKLLVTRNGVYLGRLTPNSVEPSQTVCDLNARDINPGVRIQPGDQVTLADSVGQ